MGMPTGHTRALLDLANPPKDNSGPKPMSFPEVARRRHTLIGNAWSVLVAQCLFRLLLLLLFPAQPPQEMGDFLDSHWRTCVSVDILARQLSCFRSAKYAARCGIMGSVGPCLGRPNPWRSAAGCLDTKGGGRLVPLGFRPFVAGTTLELHCASARVRGQSRLLSHSFFTTLALGRETRLGSVAGNHTVKCALQPVASARGRRAH